MRVMDGVMAIPAILLAIALVALLGASVKVVIIAIAIPEIPRVTRLVRSVVLSVRDLPYVEAARSNGTRVAKLLRRHILPSTAAPLIVQGTFICASAILTEAGLSFLGAGTPPEIPHLGQHDCVQPALPADCPLDYFCARHLSGTGGAGGQPAWATALRDRLDPRISRRM